MRSDSNSRLATVSPRLVSKSCDLTVDSRRMMASAPESFAASVATEARLDSGAEAIILRESTVKSHDFDTSLGLSY